jgi:hypothetical protein
MPIHIIDTKSREYRRIKQIIENGGRLYRLQIVNVSCFKKIKRKMLLRKKDQTLLLINFNERKDNGLITSMSAFENIERPFFYLSKSGIIFYRNKNGRKIIGRRNVFQIIDEIKVYL